MSNVRTMNAKIFRLLLYKNYPDVYYYITGTQPDVTRNTHVDASEWAILDDVVEWVRLDDLLIKVKPGFSYPLQTYGGYYTAIEENIDLIRFHMI